MYSAAQLDVEVTALLVVDCARADARRAAREKMMVFIVSCVRGLKMFDSCVRARGMHNSSVLRL